MTTINEGDQVIISQAVIDPDLHEGMIGIVVEYSGGSLALQVIGDHYPLGYVVVLADGREVALEMVLVAL